MREFNCKEIGAQLGISADRVRQIQNEAILKCKIYCQQRGLELSDILASRGNISEHYTLQKSSKQSKYRTPKRTPRPYKNPLNTGT